MEPKRVVRNLTEQVRRRNREIVGDAFLKASMGLVFTLVVFGFLFGFWCFLGLYFAPIVGLSTLIFASIMTAIFLIVAFWSAWRRVNPLAGVGRMTEQQLFLTALSHASGDIFYASPRHVTAGAAVVLVGGPSSLIDSLAHWNHRLPGGAELIEAAAELLADCREGVPAKSIRDPKPATLLRRLALIKGVPRGDSFDVVLTERGSKILGKGKSKSAESFRD